MLATQYVTVQKIAQMSANYSFLCYKHPYCTLNNQNSFHLYFFKDIYPHIVVLMTSVNIWRHIHGSPTAHKTFVF